jgi:hypothetical protein
MNLVLVFDVGLQYIKFEWCRALAPVVGMIIRCGSCCRRCNGGPIRYADDVNTEPRMWVQTITITNKQRSTRDCIDLNFLYSIICELEHRADTLTQSDHCHRMQQNKKIQNILSMEMINGFYSKMHVPYICKQ